MKSNFSHAVEVQMMFRKSIDDVFRAIIDPEITTKFWFTKSSGKLMAGKEVVWEWEMYGVKADIKVLEVIENEKIAIEWGDPKTTVHFLFSPLSDTQTYVEIKNFGFTQTGHDLIEAIKDNTGGFTTVLDGMKAYLEHGIQLNLVADKFPHAHKSVS